MFVHLAICKGAGTQTAKSPVGTRKGDACRTWFEHVE
jgi:hypothetical protein